MEKTLLKIKRMRDSYVFNEAGNLSFLSRLAILFIFLLLACFVTLCLFSLFLTYSSTLSNTLEKAFGGSSNANFFLSSSLLLVFGLVFGFGNWIIKTHDKKKEFSDTFKQKNEILFSESIKLFSQEDKKQKKIGLMQLVYLKKVGFVEAGRIDLLITGKGDLRDGNLESAHLEGIDLSSMDLRGANLKGAKLTKANLEKVNFSRSDITNKQTNLTKADLDGAVLTYADLTEANLMSAYLVEAKLMNANLFKANLMSADLVKAELMYADLTEANLMSADLIEAKLMNANLVEANLMNANLAGANLKNADLTRAILKSATLISATLNQTKLCNADLTGADLRKVELNGTDLTEADLRGANMEEVKGLQDNCLVGAKIDKETKFSEGIDIKKLGATYKN